ncbi:MAG: DUF6166 domain-containing protein [Alphaproteobacteria bacterium]
MSEQKIYEGRRLPTGCVVTVDGRPLDPRYDVRVMADHFEWGYDGNGPRQLAFALLADHFGRSDKAMGAYRRLTNALIETLDADSWSITGQQIDQALEAFTDVPLDLAGLIKRIRGEA